MEMDSYVMLFGGLTAVCAAFQWYVRSSKTTSVTEKSANFQQFQRRWLLIYYIVMASDWLQGPYVYSLYESLGFGKSEIAVLFIAGFGSSMVFGTFVGSLADKFGRKKMAIVFGFLYSAACLTKLSNKFYVLLFGRILSGIATSLLFSVFEAWMVDEHHKKGFSPDLLPSTFSLATFGNGIVAILSGLVASFVAHHYGFRSPFMVSLALLVIATFIVFSSWTENYGNSTIQVHDTLMNAVSDLRADLRIPLLGLMQSLFEGAMYTFVFMWTPALNDRSDEEDESKEEDEPLPYGLIFACFMVCIMIGSSLFEILLRFIALERILVTVFATAALSLLIPVLTNDKMLIMLSFLLFELCCGIYFPTMGTCRGKYIPEKTRSTIMNFFRAPLNFLVVAVLVKVASFDNSTVFLICCVWLGLAFLMSNYFLKLTSAPQPNRVDQVTAI